MEPLCYMVVISASGFETSVRATLPRSFLNMRLNKDISLSNKKRKNNLVHDL